MKKLIFIILAILAVFYLNFAYAGIPHLINYQGRLTDSNGTPLNGSYDLIFRIYDVEIGGNPLWEETHSGSVIQKGIFGVLLGSSVSLDNLPFDKQYYLEIKVNNEVMGPRQRITSAAYAIAGVPQGVIVMWSGKISDIPSGWALCDGTRGTPDLRDRFIVGARQDDGTVAKTNITGSLTLSGDGSMPAHSHGVGTLTTDINGAHIHTLQFKPQGSQGEYDVSDNPFTDNAVPTGTSIWSDAGGTYRMTSAGAHTHSLSGSTGTAGSGTKVVAAYYALAFIMKL